MPIVSTNIRLRHPEHFVVGEHSIVDDFCYFSTRVRIGDFAHVASGCTVAGGAARLFALGSYSSVSSGARIWCTSDDFARDVVTIVPDWLEEEEGPVKEHVISGDVILEDCTAVGSNAVVMPRNHVPEGTVIGALTYVPPDFPFEPWSVYAGIPARRVGPRDRDRVRRQVDTIRARLARLAVERA